MAYNTNLLSLVHSLPDGSFGMWVYRSADAIATVAAANYITDGIAKGMNVRDVVLVLDTNVPTTNWCTVLTIGATGLVDLSPGTAIAES